MIDERHAYPAFVRKAPQAGFYEDQRLRQLLAYARKMAALNGFARTKPQTSTRLGRPEEFAAAVCAVLLHIPRRTD